MEIGKLIKAARLEKGLTQEELGEIVGVQKSAIAKYESGKVVNIKRSTLQKLAIALDLNGSDFFSEPTDQDDGLPESVLKLIEFAKTVPEEKADAVLQAMRVILKSF